MFKLGQKVRLKISAREGTIAAVYEGSFAPGATEENSYLIEFEGGVGTSTMMESAIESIENEWWKPPCECGLKYARSGGKHSSYCPLYERNE